MQKLLLTTALVFVGGAAFAEGTPETSGGFTGEIKTVIAKTGTDDKMGATTSFGLDLNAVNGAAFGRMEFAVDSTSNNLKLDEWALGTATGVASFSFGKQGNLWVDTESLAATSTIEEPTMGTSIQVTAMGVKAGVAFTDISADVTDLENVQLGYATDFGPAAVDTAIDYNLDSSEWVTGTRLETQGLIIPGAGLGGVVSYGSASETFGFEAFTTISGVTAYVAGDQDDMAQDVGANYETNLGGLGLEAGVNYNMDSEEFNPKITASFNF